MTDDQFFSRQGPFSLSQIAALAGAELPSDAPCDLMVRGVAPLESAKHDELSVFSDVRHAADFAAGHACAIVTTRKLAGYPHNGACLLLVRDPQTRLHTRGSSLSSAPCRRRRASMYPRRSIRPLAWRRSQIDSGVVIGAHVRHGRTVSYPRQCRHRRAVEIGEACIVGPGAAISHTLIGAGFALGPAL